MDVDALSYDFYPLQGLPTSSGNANPGPNWDAAQRSKAQPRAARISALEIAIRAQSKRLLAHPLVVQQLEAIWAGTIVFHSAADSLHRGPVKVTPNQNRGYGAAGSRGPTLQASPDRLQPAKQRDHLEPTAFTVRRSVTLYDPQQASLFKLSRLRVPRYRQFLSTASFAVLLGLYLAVLFERSLTISALEIIFWFWSAGFMLDEIVGFNEQGFSLYIMSFWNTFDLGILLLLFCYYCLRLYGIIMPDARKHHVAGMAYDILAANAVLLFPRLFSVLDHYRYFSQLLIAFRMMALDLAAVFVLIIISCSGFFVAFTMSFTKDENYDASSVAYALFQILMGFTPAAWESWGNYNLLGKGILTLFLFICHFLIVTILITVLTNSFMAIVQNANEEHQFVFAVNAISLVKSDALFSYIAPTNVIAWLLAPLRFVIPFRQFVRINRTVIKVTHFPILFIIYAYERLILRGSLFEPTDLVEHRGRPGARGTDALTGGLSIFSPKQSRLREPSVATYHKDKALEEVFRRPFRDNTIRGTQKSQVRRDTSNVVNHWMSEMGPNGTASPPMEQDHSIVDRLETRRFGHRSSQLVLRRKQPGRGRDVTEATMSVVSDPQEFAGNDSIRLPPRLGRDNSDIPTTTNEGFAQTDADGDDELITNDDEDLITLDRPTTIPPKISQPTGPSKSSGDYFMASSHAKPQIPHFNPLYSSSIPMRPSTPKQLGNVFAVTGTPPKRVRHHNRMPSTNTVVYDPPAHHSSSTSSSTGSRKAVTARNSAQNAGTTTPNNLSTSAGRRSPKRLSIALSGPKAVPRPIMPPRTAFQSAPDLAGMMALNTRRGRRSSFSLDIGSDLGDNKAVGGGFIGAVPASIASQMAFANVGMKARRAAQREEDDQSRMSKLVLARMNALEEGFRDVIKEVKDLNKGREDVVQAVKNVGGRNGGGVGRVNSKKEGRGGQKESEESQASTTPADGPPFATNASAHKGSSV